MGNLQVFPKQEQKKEEKKDYIVCLKEYFNDSKQNERDILEILSKFDNYDTLDAKHKECYNNITTQYEVAKDCTININDLNCHPNLSMQNPDNIIIKGINYRSKSNDCVSLANWHFEKCHGVPLEELKKLIN